MVDSVNFPVIERSRTERMVISKWSQEAPDDLYAIAIDFLCPSNS